MGEDTNDLVVDSADLRAVLQRLQKLGGKTPGPGIWRASAGALEVEWKGGSEGLDAEGSLELAVRIDAAHMTVLAQSMAKTGAVRIRLRDRQRISFGTYSCPYDVVQPSRTDLLHVQATPYDVLMLAYRHRSADIDNAGLATELDAVRDTLADTIDRAARVLGWVNIGPDLLRTWVEAHLAAVAEGKPTFDIVAPKPGQLDLFE